jgi:hypothetical protein
MEITQKHLSPETRVRIAFHVLALSLPIGYQVFHRILDLKHGLDFYPGLLFDYHNYPERYFYSFNLSAGGILKEVYAYLFSFLHC